MDHLEIDNIFYKIVKEINRSIVSLFPRKKHFLRIIFITVKENNFSSKKCLLFWVLFLIIT